MRNSESSRSGEEPDGRSVWEEKKRKLGGEGEGFISRSQSELKVMTKKVRESEGKEESRSCRRSMQMIVKS